MPEAEATDPRQNSSESSTMPVRRSTRICHEPERYGQFGFNVVQGYCNAMMGSLLPVSKPSYDIRYLLNLLIDPAYGTYDNLPPVGFSPHMLKASMHDPDSPRLHEAKNGEHREEFLKAMIKEITELEAHGTWTVMPKSCLPAG